MNIFQKEHVARIYDTQQVYSGHSLDDPSTRKFELTRYAPLSSLLSALPLVGPSVSHSVVADHSQYQVKNPRGPRLAPPRPRLSQPDGLPGFLLHGRPELVAAVEEELEVETDWPELGPTAPGPGWPWPWPEMEPEPEPEMRP